MVEHWNIPIDVKVVEMPFWGSKWDSILLSSPTGEAEIFGEKHLGKVPSIEDGHSWARYRGEYGMDNLTKNFYDEPEPTPGYENHRYYFWKKK